MHIKFFSLFKNNHRGYTCSMLWIKAFHIVFVASWFAGLFYLPRIFVNLAMVSPGSSAERERLLLMARKLMRFTTLLAVPAVGLGLWLWLNHWLGRGLGLGRGLMAAVWQMQDWHSEYICLGVSPDNALANGFYARLGFARRGYEMMILEGAGLQGLVRGD